VKTKLKVGDIVHYIPPGRGLQGKYLAFYLGADYTVTAVKWFGSRVKLEGPFWGRFVATTLWWKSCRFRLVSRSFVVGQLRDQMRHDELY
jgi:hypothetical protein